MSFLLLDLWLRATTRLRSRDPRGERGQATAEYALVILGAAAVAGLLLAWATKTHTLSRLFDSVIDAVMPG